MQFRRIIGFFMFIIVLGSFIWLLFIYPPESYLIFDPHIDTEFAPAYTPQKFDKVKVGMHKNQVIRLIGEPLFIHGSTYKYTNDGKIHRFKNNTWWRANDYAWYNSEVIFDSEQKVIEVRKGWYYD